MFGNYQGILYVAIMIGGDHSKDSFTMLLTMHVEYSDNQKRYIDEVIGEIESE